MKLIVALFIFIFAMGAGAQSQTESSEYTSVADIDKAVSTRMDQITRAKTYDTKYQALSNLKDFLDHESDKLGKTNGPLQDDITTLDEALKNPDEEGVFGDDETSHKTPADLQAELKLKKDLLDNQTQLQIRWNFYTNLFEIPYEVFFNQASVFKRPTSPAFDCSNAEEYLRKSKNQDKLHQSIIKIVHDMCSLPKS